MKKDRNLRKKLSLNRETLRSLEEDMLNQADGGVTAICSVPCTITNKCSECLCGTTTC